MWWLHKNGTLLWDGTFDSTLAFVNEDLMLRGNWCTKWLAVFFADESFLMTTAMLPTDPPIDCTYTHTVVDFGLQLPRLLTIFSKPNTKSPSQKGRLQWPKAHSTPNVASQLTSNPTLGSVWNIARLPSRIHAKFRESRSKVCSGSVLESSLVPPLTWAKRPYVTP